MPSSTFNNIVNKLLKNKNKIIEIKKIKTLLSHFFPEQRSDQKFYKIIYNLKNKGYLLTIKRNIFLIKDPQVNHDENEIIDKFYRTLLKKHCKDYIDKKCYIGGLKALELNMKNFSIPDSILIFNQEKQASEIIAFDKEVIIKNYSSGGNKLFSFFKQYTYNMYIGKNTFLVANLELALLESLYNPSIISHNYINELVKKTLRKHRKILNIKIWEEILKKNKHHSSINRLHKLAIQADPLIAEKIKGIIKKYGYFIY